MACQTFAFKLGRYVPVCSACFSTVLYVFAGLVRAILAEMLGLSASALGSVQVALTGAPDSGSEQPAGVHCLSYLFSAAGLLRIG